MNEVYPSITFNDRWVRLIGIPIVGFIVPLVFLDDKMNNGLVAYLPVWIIATIHTIIYWEGNRFIYLQTRKRFPYVSQTTRRLLWLVILGLTYTTFVSFLADEVIEYLCHTVFMLPDNHGPDPTAEYIAGLIPVIVCITFYESVYYFKQLRVALAEAERLKKENVQSQLETLKNQVNPHFLFNSLNTLATIIPEDADLAVEFVQKLSKVYRYILEIRELQTVSLREELVALRAYTFLLQIRFGTNLETRIAIPDDYLNDRIVPLSLQMLIENAVKHNIISTQKPLLIEVFMEKDKVIVRNNLQRKNQPTDSTGLGLQNIQNRYQLLANQPVDVIVTTQAFVVSLPFLNLPIRLANESLTTE